jgi:hypothetical protein
MNIEVGYGHIDTMNKQTHGQTNRLRRTFVLVTTCKASLPYKLVV